MLRLTHTYDRVHHIFVHFKDYYKRSCICLNCYHRFADDYGMLGTTPQSSRYDHIYCPYCGILYSHKNYHKLDDNNFGLWDLKISLYTFKEKVKIALSGKICHMNEEYFSSTTEMINENIEFDVGKRLTTFTQTRTSYRHCITETNSFDLGNPLHLDRFRELSILNNIQPYSMIYNDKFWTNFLKTVREELMKRLLTKHDTLSKGWYDSYSKYDEPDCGKVLPSLFNYAFRLRHPSFRNYNFNSRFWGLEKFVSPDFDSCAIPLHEDDCKLLFKKANLPYSKKLRSFIARDFNHFILLCVLNQQFKITSSDLLLDRNMQELFSTHLSSADTNLFGKVHREDLMEWNADLVSFLSLLCDKFKTVPFKKLLAIEELKDCVSMFKDLSKENIEKFHMEKIRTREIHDRLIRLTNQQQSDGFKLDVPEPIVNRFLMQRDRLKAFIPEHSKLLADAGRKMHICVGNYAKRVLKGECVISFLSDNSGKVVACLEIKGNKLVQARLFGNKPVHNNAEINAFILNYAKETKLVIATTNVNQEVTVKNDDEIAV